MFCLQKWLKPGGKLLITDYCCKDGEWSQKFTDYVDQRGYYLLAPPKYGQVNQDFYYIHVINPIHVQYKTGLHSNSYGFSEHSVAL